jgi:hypothetical protein
MGTRFASAIEQTSGREWGRREGTSAGSSSEGQRGPTEPIEAAARTLSKPATPGTSDDKLLLFGVNPLHNIVHINGSSDLNILNINQPDNALHLASAALGLYFGLAGRRTVAPAA